MLLDVALPPTPTAISRPRLPDASPRCKARRGAPKLWAGPARGVAPSAGAETASITADSPPDKGGPAPFGGELVRHRRRVAVSLAVGAGNASGPPPGVRGPARKDQLCLKGSHAARY